MLTYSLKSYSPLYHHTVISFSYICEPSLETQIPVCCKINWVTLTSHYLLTTQLLGGSWITVLSHSNSMILYVWYLLMYVLVPDCFLTCSDKILNKTE